MPNLDIKDFINKKVYGKAYTLYKRVYGEAIDPSIDGICGKDIAPQQAISQQPDHPGFVELERHYEDNKYQENEDYIKNTEMPLRCSAKQPVEEEVISYHSSLNEMALHDNINQLRGIPEDTDEFTLAMINQFPDVRGIDGTNESKTINPNLNSIRGVLEHGAAIEINQTVDEIKGASQAMEPGTIHQAIDDVRGMPRQEPFIDLFDPLLDKKMNPMPDMFNNGFLGF